MPCVPYQISSPFLALIGRQDVPLMTAADTLALEPAPLLIIYQ